MRRRAERGKEKRARDAGFTLLEVLGTLVVFGILLEVLAQGLHVGLRGWTVAQEIGAGTATLETTDLALRELLERASPADPLTYDRAFIGTPSSMTFTTTLPKRPGETVPLEADVSVVSDGQRLVLNWRPHHARWIEPPPLPAAEFLVNGVIGLQLAYFQPARDGRGGRWLTAWKSPDPPRLVRIHFAFTPGDRRHWPDIIAAVMRDRPPR
jgi:general secretion pathway protein J